MCVGHTSEPCKNGRTNRDAVWERADQYMGVNIGAISKIWLNDPRGAAIRPYVELLWPLVIISYSSNNMSITELTDDVSLFMHEHAEVLEDLVHSHNVFLYINNINARFGSTTHRRSQWSTCLTAVWEEPDSNLTAGCCVYRNSCWDTALGMGCTSLQQCLGPLSLPPTTRWQNEY